MTNVAAIFRSPLPLLGLLATSLFASGCVVKDTRPLPKIGAVQSTQQIPDNELLDVAIHEFEPGIPKELAEDEDALAKRRIYPDVRKAEARMLPATLRATLENSGQWGAVRVVPQSVQFVDVIVTGRIIVSSGTDLALAITARDSTGRTWFEDRIYKSPADIGSYKTEAALKARDPFQNVYSQIANDLVAARNKLPPADRREVRRVTELRFAQDLAPDAFAGYLQKDAQGLTRLARLPADDDPLLKRVAQIRERDASVIDTVDGYNGNFNDKLRDSYGGWRRTSYDAIEKEDRTRSQARARAALGAAAVLASIFVSGSCPPNDFNCQRLESAARTAGAVGGTAAVLSGIKKFSDAKVAAQEVKELATSFQNEVAPQVVELEGRTLRLTGTAEEQYREWRRLLGEIYREESGGVVAVPAAAPAAAGAPAAAPATPAPARAPAPQS
jgi:hypothetical protein